MSRRTNVIQQEIEARKIPYLLHFTVAENIPTIVKHGLISREGILSHSDPAMRHALASDGSRLDGRDDAISVSLPAFWWEMFAAKRDRGPDHHWVFLALDPAIMWRLECHFFPDGAGRDSKKYGARPGTTTAFLEMFDDIDPYGRTMPEASFRRSHYLPDCFPSFPPTEIQVLEPIQTEWIMGSFFLDDDCEAFLAGEMEKLDTPGWTRKAWLGATRLSIQRSWGYVERSMEPGPSAKEERWELYNACAHEDGEPAYLGDGVWLYPED